MRPINRRGTPQQSPFFSNFVCGASMSVGAEAAGAITVTTILNNADQVNVEKIASVGVYLSANADGSTFATAVTSLTAGTNGAVHQETVGLTARVICNASGEVDIVVTGTGVTVYLVVVLPDGSLVVSGAITLS